MNLAFFIYNRVQMYSGGQYHAFALGKALAARGQHVDFYWNVRPIFVSEFPQVPTRDVLLSELDFSQQHRYDYVVVAPSGFFVPAYYEAALRLAGEAGARICLLNYESANWFNLLAPTPDDPRVWDYWRRVVVYGGLVVSSTQQADSYARSFYCSPLTPLAFAVASPPINSEQAARVRGSRPAKDGSVVVFVRREHDYKGGEDLLKLSPHLLAGRCLHVVCGGQEESALLQELQARYAGQQVTIRAHSRLSVAEKFSLLARARVLLFPSSFEGFGYPPLEAFAVGTEVVCYDLPVLRETLADLAFFAAAGRIDQLEACLVRALHSQRDTSALVERAEAICGFARVGAHFAAVLEQHRASVQALSASPWCVQWGPSSPAEAAALPAPPFPMAYPPFVEQCIPGPQGLLIVIRLSSSQPIQEVEVEGQGIRYLSLAACEPTCCQADGFQYILKILGTGAGSALMRLLLRDGSVHRECVHLVAQAEGGDHDA